FDECAEAECETQVGAALALDPQSLDGLQTLASLRLSQSRRPDACIAIQQVAGRVKHLKQLVRSRSVMDDIAGSAEPEEFDDAPDTDFCIATVKLLIECAGEGEAEGGSSLASEALDLAAQLLQEDDENVELWYLMGVAALSMPAPDVDCAQHSLEQARDMILRVREEERQRREEEVDVDADVDAEEDPDSIYAEQYALIEEHLAIIYSDAGAGAKAGVKAGAGAVDEEWSSGEEEEESEMVVEK
ncbi:hypothetical protein B484DRAFT_389441, partial [Ochromonadaceae sp. CCMP2298]